MLENKNMKKTWFSETHQQATKMNIDMRIQFVEQRSKSEWKKEIKEKIQSHIEKELQEETMKKTKLRHLKNKKSFGMEDYVASCDAESVGKIMSIRLNNMVDTKCNYKGIYEDTTCVFCGEEETTEHLLVCDYYRQFVVERIDKSVGTEELCSTEWLKKAARAMDTIQEVRRQHSSVEDPALKGSDY